MDYILNAKGEYLIIQADSLNIIYVDGKKVYSNIEDSTSDKKKETKVEFEEENIQKES